MRRFSSALLMLLGIAALQFEAHAAPPASAGEVRYYAGGLEEARYSALDQIKVSNLQNLRIAWRHPGVDARTIADNPTLKVSNNFRSTPIMVKGVLFTSNAVGLVEAIDPGNGKTLWTQVPLKTGNSSGVQGPASRAIAYWESGTDERIVTVKNHYLFALDAKTGNPVKSFGDNGMVDLTDGSGGQQFVWSAPGPIVVRDVIVLGGGLTRAGSDFGQGVLPGDIHGYDVRTGKLRWVFHTIPREGEYGTDTWLNDSWKTNGKGKVWSFISADEETGYIYAPLSAAVNDWYGGERPGANLFSDSLVCIDVKNGQRVWHYQLVHHDLWDYDLPAAPILADLTVNGKKIKAVVQVTKMAWAFAFDRITGKPIWPIEERRVPQTNVPSEWTSPTQPFPTKPAPFDRQGFTDNDLIDFTPELHAQAVAIARKYVHGEIFTPPTIKGQAAEEKQGTLYLPGWVGGANWTGAAIDPESGVMYVPSVTAPYVVGLVKNGEGYRRAREQTLYLDGPQGLPLTKPPYGRITAIDMNTGEHLWMVPNGDGPRNHPLLKDLHLPPLGQPGRASPLLTKTVLFLGEGDMVGLSMPPFSGGNMFRAYDKKTGRVLWEKDLEAGTTGGPMSYMYKGKQYVVVAVGSEKHAAELVALSLP